MPLWLGTSSRDPPFWAYLILPDHRGSCNQSKIPWIIWLLYFDQLIPAFCATNAFDCFASLWFSLNLLSINSSIRQGCLFICVAFKSNAYWSNAQRASALTTMILPTIASTIPWLEVLQLREIRVANKHNQNITKHLTYNYYYLLLLKDK